MHFESQNLDAQRAVKRRQRLIGDLQGAVGIAVFVALVWNWPLLLRSIA